MIEITWGKIDERAQLVEAQYEIRKVLNNGVLSSTQYGSLRLWDKQAPWSNLVEQNSIEESTGR